MAEFDRKLALFQEANQSTQGQKDQAKIMRILGQRFRISNFSIGQRAERSESGAVGGVRDRGGGGGNGGERNVL